MRGAATEKARLLTVESLTEGTTMVHANKSPLKIWEKKERGRIQRLPKFFEYPLFS